MQQRLDGHLWSSNDNSKETKHFKLKVLTALTTDDIQEIEDFDFENGYDLDSV